VCNIRVRSFDVDYLDVYWDVEPSYEDINNFEFVLEKSPAEFGSYEDLTKPLINRFHVRDNTVRGQRSYYNRIYYRVRAINRTTGESKVFPETGGVRLAALPDLAALEMARINNLKIKEFTGRKMWVYPKKRNGQRCAQCYDETLQRRTRSNCGTCFDTGWVGGYHSPVETYGLIVSPNETTIHANFGNIDSENTTLVMGNYPELSEGDLVLEAENIRWRVSSSIGKTKKSRALVRQQATIHRIPNSDVDYRVPINLTEDEIKDLIASPERNYTNPQTLESANLAQVLTKVFGNG
jgi:hypothetical protein